jgi:hypothetical protein
MLGIFRLGLLSRRTRSSCLDCWSTVLGLDILRRLVVHELRKGDAKSRP